MLAELVTMMLRELTARRQLTRTPEPEMVMNESSSVMDYSLAGDENGIFAGLYLFQLNQICGFLRPGDRVLDLGCGPAKLLCQVAALHPQCEFIGVDLSDEMLNHGNRAIAAESLTNVTLHKADMTQLSEINDHSFDVVLSNWALHHLPDSAALEKAFGAIRRVLKPGGGLYVSDFGRVKTPAGIRFFIEQGAKVQSAILNEDYANSIQAAFTLSEIEQAAYPHFASDIRYHRDLLGYTLAVVNPTRQASHGFTPELRRRVKNLNPIQFDMLKNLEALMRFSGLRTGLTRGIAPSRK